MVTNGNINLELRVLIRNQVPEFQTNICVVDRLCDDSTGGVDRYLGVGC